MMFQWGVRKLVFQVWYNGEEYAVYRFAFKDKQALFSTCVMILPKRCKIYAEYKKNELWPCVAFVESIPW